MNDTVKVHTRLPGRGIQKSNPPPSQSAASQLKLAEIIFCKKNVPEPLFDELWGLK